MLMKKFFKNIISFFLVGIVTFFLFEIFLRFSAIGQPSAFQLNPKLGSVFKPSQPLFSIKEGMYIGETNQYGYLGPSYGYEKRNEVFRIALVGDSYIEGLHLFDKYHLRSNLERNLEKVTGKKVEIMNFGRSGYNFNRMFIYYEEYIREFSPDLVLFFISPGDLIEKATEIGPVCILENDSLKIDYSFNQSSKYLSLKSTEIIREFSFYNLIQNCWVIIRNKKTPEILFDKVYSWVKNQKVSSGKKNKSNSKDNFFEVNKAIFKKLSDDNLLSRNKIAMVIRTELSTDYKYIISNYNIPRIPLYTYLNSLNEDGKLNYWPATNQQGHWNHLAHKIIAEYLASEIFNKIMLADKKQNLVNISQKQ